MREVRLTIIVENMSTKIFYHKQPLSSSMGELQIPFHHQVIMLRLYKQNYDPHNDGLISTRHVDH